MEKFDSIIIGGGLAGLAAAYTLADQGLEVLVLERGDYAGAKNVTGGRLYLNPVRDLFPDLWQKAPFERFIAKEEICVMAEKNAVTLSYSGDEQKGKPYQSCSVLRAKFDRWLAKQAERKGAAIVTKSKVEDLIMEDRRVVGVRVSGDELKADTVIAADGVLSLTAEKAGLRQPGKAKDYAVGFKEVIEMDRQILQNRFSLEEKEGAARLFLGEVTKGRFGGGFLYTNQDSISLGIVVGIEDLATIEPAIHAPDLLDQFKERPEVAQLIRNGRTVEYSAHVIPEGGYQGISQLYGDGILITGDAAGLSLNLGITVRGMDYALASGYYAAQTVLKAKEKQDYSAATLKVYEELLKDSFVLKDFASFKEMPVMIENPRVYNYYPELINSIFQDLYTVPTGPKNRFYKDIRKYIGLGDLLPMLKDVRKGMKI